MLDNKRKVCIPISTRGKYGKLKSTFNEINKDKKLELQIILAGALLLDSYGNFREIIKEDGFEVAGELPFLLDGDTNEVISMSAGLAQMEFSRLLERLKPDIVLITADRFESLAFAQSALCMNCFIAHLEGGEISGSIDERIRHAITKLSHIHFVSNKESAERVKRMGEYEKNIIISGNPSVDIIIDIDLSDLSKLKSFLSFKDNSFDENKAYLVISQHPVVTEVDSFLDQIKITFESISSFDMQKIWILPNLDAGYNSVNNYLKQQKQKGSSDIFIVNSLPLNIYSILLNNSACLIGNSSSGIRESSYLGVPSINIGNRQFGRLRNKNTIDCDHNVQQIRKSIEFQLNHGPYQSSSIYGKGDSGKIIAKSLSECELSLNKTITF